MLAVTISQSGIGLCLIMAIGLLCFVCTFGKEK